MKDRKLKVGAIDWLVRSAPTVVASDKWGVADYKARQIVLEEIMPPDLLREVMLHELVHVCDEAGAAGDDCLNETTVKRVSNMLASVFRDNSWLKEVLFG